MPIPSTLLQFMKQPVNLQPAQTQVGTPSPAITADQVRFSTGIEQGLQQDLTPASQQIMQGQMPTATGEGVRPQRVQDTASSVEAPGLLGRRTNEFLDQLRVLGGQEPIHTRIAQRVRLRRASKPTTLTEVKEGTVPVSEAGGQQEPLGPQPTKEQKDRANFLNAVNAGKLEDKIKPFTEKDLKRAEAGLPTSVSPEAKPTALGVDVEKPGWFKSGVAKFSEGIKAYEIGKVLEKPEVQNALADVAMALVAEDPNSFGYQLAKSVKEGNRSKQFNEAMHDLMTSSDPSDILSFNLSPEDTSLLLETSKQLHEAMAADTEKALDIRKKGAETRMAEKKEKGFLSPAQEALLQQQAQAIGKDETQVKRILTQTENILDRADKITRNKLGPKYQKVTSGVDEKTGEAIPSETQRVFEQTFFDLIQKSTIIPDEMKPYIQYQYAPSLSAKPSGFGRTEIPTYTNRNQIEKVPIGSTFYFTDPNTGERILYRRKSETEFDVAK